MKVNAGLSQSRGRHLPSRTEVNLLYVLVEVRFAQKGLAAEVTSLFKMYFPVSCELAALRRGVVALSALVGLLSGMRPPVIIIIIIVITIIIIINIIIIIIVILSSSLSPVHRQVGEVDEDLAAVLAGVPPRHHAPLGPHARLHGRL